jgi:predicted RNase H-like nuclease (RuvC/YqgF family)
MIIIVPLAFAGASYINGEDPIANFKSLTGMEATEQPREAPAKDSKPKEKPAKKPATESMEALKKENTRLKREIKERDQAIKDLQEQLKNKE